MRTDRSFARLLNLSTPTTPDEVTFLVSRRQTLRGEVTQLAKEIEENPGKIAERQKMIDAIDLLLAAHPLKIDGTKIPGVRRKKTSVLPHGKLTQGVMRVFREAKPGAKLNTFTISLEVRRHAGLLLERRQFNEFHKRVLRTLNYLQTRGGVERIAATGGSVNEEAYWRARIA